MRKNQNFLVYGIIAVLGLMLLLGNGNDKGTVSVEHGVNFRHIPVGNETWVTGPLGGRWHLQRRIDWLPNPPAVDVRTPGANVQVQPYYK